MRPHSILAFERLYLISLLLVLVQQVMGFFFAQNMFNRFAAEAGPQAPGLGSLNGIVIVWMLFGVAVSVGIPLLFWWLAARKRQEFARWLLLVISILSVLGCLFSLVVMLLMPGDALAVAGLGGIRSLQVAMVLVDAASEAAGVVALVYLFRAESTLWFRNVNPAASAEVFR
jgi:hypothetical protein